MKSSDKQFISDAFTHGLVWLESAVADCRDDYDKEPLLECISNLKDAKRKLEET